MKKMKKNIYICGLAACMLALASCTDNFDETNTNPNKITVASGKLDASAMFEQTLYGSANFFTYYSWFWCDELIQHTAHTGGTTRQEHRYFIGDQNWKALWNTYSRYASNDVNMINLAKAQGSSYLQAVGLTMKVLFMSNLTDIYGDIPYKEAFKAEEGIKQPVFDSQESVYQQMCAELEEANRIYASQPYVEEKNRKLDGMYSFDMAKWRKFNNSLYLRLLCRISGRKETIVDGTSNVAQKMAEIVSSPETYPIFEANEDNATVHYTGIAPYTSEFDNASYTESSFTTGSYKLTEQMIRMMVIKDATNTKVDLYTDPRLPIIGRKKREYWAGTIAGAAMGEESNNGDKNAAYLNYKVLCRNNCDEWFMDYAEVEFILAEAALKGLIPGGETVAKAHYEKAITASLQKWSDFASPVDPTLAITAEGIQTFLNSSLASWDQATTLEAKSELIGNQKYLALFWIGMEDWHEYRRTEYPKLTVGSGCVYNDMILPTRFAYPSTTIATNRVHADEALQRMGGENDMKTPVWWSKKAIEK